MRTIILSALLCLTLACCGGGPKKGEVAYTEAKGYFVKNTVDSAATITERITTKAQFDALLGSATTMASLPTPIDFSKEFAVAVILPQTDLATTIKVNSLSWDGAKLNLDYGVTTGERRSFTTRPVEVLIVGNEYGGELNVTRQ